jgi:ribonuclease BN (tRNA processing enzyme)
MTKKKSKSLPKPPAPTPAKPKAPIEPIQIKCLGIGDGWASLERNHSSYVYRLGSRNLLVDCGEPVSRSLKAAGIPADAVDDLLLSHLHLDHLGGYFMLIQGLWLEPRRKPLTVYLPAEGIAPVKNLLRAGYIFDELLQFPITYQPLRSGEPFASGQARVTPYANTHLNRLRQQFQAKYPQAFESFSFLFEVGGRRVAHSADIGAVEDLDPLLRTPVEALVCELAHLEPRRLFEYLRGKPIKRVIFVHLGRAQWANQGSLRDLAFASLGGIPCSFARDGEAFVI